MEDRQQPGEKPPQPGQDLAQVVPGGNQQHVDRVANLPFEVAASQVTVVFHVPDLRLDGTATSQFFLDCACCHAALLSGDEHLCVLDAMATVAAIDVTALGLDPGEDLHLLELLGQRVSVIRAPGQAAGAEDEARLVGRRERGLHTELVALVGLALAQAFHFRGVDAVELVLVLRFLLDDSLGRGQCVGERRFTQRVARFDLALDVAHHSPDARAQLLDLRAHATVLLGR